MPEPKPDPMIARDLVGYGEFPPNPAWPGGALIAVNFNLNVEGGGEASLFNGDPVSEGMLNDIGVSAYTGRRAPLVESVFEFGSRRGVWRVLDIFRDHSVAVSVLGVARALEQNPRWRGPLSSVATKSSATAIVGSITSMCPRTSNASTSGGPSRSSRR